MENQHAQPDSAARTSRWLIFWCFVLLVGILLFALPVWFGGSRGGRDGSLDQAVGKRLEAASLAPLTGAAKPLELADLRGKVTLINFWGTWCPPCQQEFPELYKLRQSLRREPQFQFVSVSCAFDEQGEATLAEDTEKFLRHQQADLPTYRDPFGKTQLAVAAAAGMESLAYPTTVVLDGSGTIRGLWRGYARGDETQMHALATALLHEANAGKKEQR
jgi:thiol-disulfide isomerase/thioredoxin